MPLYEYQCLDCHDKTEELQSMKDAPLELCVCGGHLERLVGHASIGLCNTTLTRDAFKTREALDDPTDKRGQIYADKAKAAGVNTTGRFYHPGLALEFGDPKAWVKDLDEIKDRCKELGWTYKIVDGDLQIDIPANLAMTAKQQFGGKKS